LAEEDAVNQLLDLGLQPGERSDRFHDSVAAGAVIRTDPEAGTEVPVGTVIDYVVSAGPEPTPTPEPTVAPVAIPDLRGVAEEDAVNQLLELGLQPGERTERFHE
jgi:serine/threonine-protein kinase